MDSSELRKQITMRRDRLPKHFIQKTLRDLAVGESAYTVPWAMSVDSEGRAWLSLGFPAEDSPFGTAAMLVERCEDGYGVNLWHCRDSKWNAESIPSGYVPVMCIAE